MKKISYSKNIAWQIIDDEVFVFDDKNDKVFLFTGIVKEIWMAINDVHCYERIIDILKSNYSNENDSIEDKVNKEIDKLIKRQLLTWSQ